MAIKVMEVLIIKYRQQDNIEKVILVAIRDNSKDESGFELYLQELRGLAEAAGGQVIFTMQQSRNRPEARTYIGKGKLEELSRLAEELEPDIILFDGELSPLQLRNLEERLPVKIIDRTMLILDIFSQRARSHEGKLQIELATLEYRLPRLLGKGRQLSRTGGGIGTRGMGEQKLELDRRYIRKRIQDIKRLMEKVEKTRSLHRKQRSRSGIKTVSLLGYTNAGKSSLFNALCQKAHNSGSPQVEADSRLFQTLDTTTRRILLAPGREILITDTVGFIQDLPHHLVAAFRSTLEEAVEADLLLHVVDISDPDFLDKMKTVEKAMEALGADREKILVVFNKIDLVPDHEALNRDVCVSALNGQGIERLIEKISLLPELEKTDTRKS